MSSSWMVFLPECFAMSHALLEISSASSTSTSAKAVSALAEMRFAPACIRIFPIGAFGMIPTFRGILYPHTLCKKPLGLVYLKAVGVI